MGRELPAGLVVIVVLGALAVVGLAGWSMMNRELKPVPRNRYVAAAERPGGAPPQGPSGSRRDQSMPRATRDLLTE